MTSRLNIDVASLFQHVDVKCARNAHAQSACWRKGVFKSKTGCMKEIDFV